MAKFNLVLALVAFALAFTLTTSNNAVAAEAAVNLTEPRVCGDTDELCYATNKPTTVLKFAKLIASTYSVSSDDVILYSGWSGILDQQVTADEWYAFSVGQTLALVAQN